MEQSRISALSIAGMISVCSTCTDASPVNRCLLASERPPSHGCKWVAALPVVLECDLRLKPYRAYGAVLAVQIEPYLDSNISPNKE